MASTAISMPFFELCPKVAVAPVREPYSPITISLPASFLSHPARTSMAAARAAEARIRRARDWGFIGVVSGIGSAFVRGGEVNAGLPERYRKCSLGAGEKIRFIFIMAIARGIEMSETKSGTPRHLTL